MIVLDGAILATVPDPALVRSVDKALRDIILRSTLGPTIDLGRVEWELPVRDVLGPATLAYLDAAIFVETRVESAVEELPAVHDDVRGLMAATAPTELDDSGLAGITSAAFALRKDRELVAAAGYRRWPRDIGHLSVLTAAAHRGRGLARVVASAAVADALANDLLPQWRASSLPSCRVADGLGFREVGAQISVLFGR